MKTQPPHPASRSWSWTKRLKIALGAVVGRALIRAIGCTLRVEAPRREEHYEGPALILALWHGPHFPVLWAYRGRGAFVITSRSADGEILTRILHGYGYRTVRGSSKRGGQRATIELARRLREGADAAIAVDGPRGPRYQVKPGVVLLAKLTGAPIAPMAVGISSYWQIPSWDRYRIPKPFARAKLVPGPLMYVAAEASAEEMEAHRRQLEETLRNLQDAVDAEMGGRTPTSDCQGTPDRFPTR